MSIKSCSASGFQMNSLVQHGLMEGSRSTIDDGSGGGGKAPGEASPFSCWSGREEKKKRKKRKEKEREKKKKRKREGKERERKRERRKRKEKKSKKDIKGAQNMFKSSVAQSKCCVFDEKR